MNLAKIVVEDIAHVKKGGADSFTDQLNCQYTVFVYSLMIILSTTKVYVDDPISCSCPSEFSGSQVDYVKKICWVSNTYSLAEDELPQNNRASGTRINYYQWVTLLMSCQALCFYLPRPIWRMLSKKSGIAINSITDAAIECYRKADLDKTDKSLDYMTQHLDRLLRTGSKRGCHGPTLSHWYHTGNYLVTIYLLIKVLYLFNAIAQLFVLGAFLQTDFHLYGFHVIQNMIREERLSSSQVFPRETICHFKLKKLGNVQRFSVQCALPMNFFYEAMFIYLWFWIVLVAFCTTISLVYWFINIIWMTFQEDTIYSVLVDMKKISLNEPRDLARKFVTEFLKRDGCFILKLVSRNSSEVLTNDLICRLWDLYKKNLEKNPSCDPKGYGSNTPDTAYKISNGCLGKKRSKANTWAPIQQSHQAPEYSAEYHVETEIN